MNSKPIVAVALFVALAAPLQLAAQEEQPEPGKQHFQRYTLSDLGTLGGSFSFGVGINNQGWAAGFSTLPGDQNQHAFLWRNGVITDLGTLGGPNSAPSFSPFSENGDIGLEAETSLPDPNGENFCGSGMICLPVLWHDGMTTVLPTLGGNNGVANQVNNRGQVAGSAETTILLPPCLAGIAEPVVWDNGVIQDLSMFPGDLAGVALAINDSGEAVGFSATCTTFHALLWRNGTVTDLGNLGGVAGNVAIAINNRGEIAGTSDLPGDGTSHAFLWQKGVMADLGALPGDFSSGALGINGSGLAVGFSCMDQGCMSSRAFLWERGAMIDLNALLPAGSPWFVTEADSINSRGQIVGGAFNAISGEVHAVLVTPCDKGNTRDTGCNEIEGVIDGGATRGRPKVILPENARRMLVGRKALRPGYFACGVSPTPDDVLRRCTP